MSQGDAKTADPPARPDYSASEGAMLLDLVRDRSIVICCGSGGVGKTTTSAALGMRAAELGRRAVVVTIDPAKRLADALGLSELGNVPTRLDGPWTGTGELWAMMLDTKGTFDDLVRQYAADQGQADRILQNRFYKNISGALSGTQDYMATEKLFELHESGEFDIVVVDTPPSRNALDFLDAPRRLVRFLDHRLYRVLVLPTRAYLRAVNIAAHAFLRTVGRVVGVEVVEDTIAFFAAFEGMEAGFRDRAGRVNDLLIAPGTAYVLVAAPRRDAVDEAVFLANHLREVHRPVSAAIINRMHPRFGPTLDSGDFAPLQQRLQDTPLGPVVENLVELDAGADAEERALVPLLNAVGDVPVVRVPLLAADVHDLEGLTVIDALLFDR